MTMGGPHFCHNSGFVQWILNIFHLAWNMNNILLVVAELGSCKDHDRQGFSIFQTHMPWLWIMFFSTGCQIMCEKKGTNPDTSASRISLVRFLCSSLASNLWKVDWHWGVLMLSLISYYNDISFYFCKHVMGTWNTHCGTFTELVGVFNCTFFINWTPANKVWE